MNTVKKDHSLGAGTGAVAGAVAGATVGTAVAGPVGPIVGALAGAVLGAKTGDEVAELVNPTEYVTTLEQTYTSKPYYTPNYNWTDYKPAYQFGYDTYGRYRGRSFDEVEPDLEREWAQAQGHSRLAWADARMAVRDGWHTIERAIPGDFDRDGR